MRLVAVVVPVLALAACKDAKPRPTGLAGSGSAAGAAAGSAPSVPAGPPDLSFIRGDVVVVETRGAITRPVRLEPTTGAWTSLGGGDANLFPTGHRVRGGLLCIATWGATEADHREQLAIVRGAEVELFGPAAQMVRNPTPTPDGATVLAETSAASFRDLYAIAADGKAARLTDNPQGNFEPAVAPDGKTVVFASSRDGNAELYAMAVAGGAATRLTDQARDDWGAVWSPDGARLGFLSDRDGAPRVYLMAASGGVATRLTTEAGAEVVEDQPHWSPDGKTLAYLRGQGPALAVVLVDVATGAARTLTPDGQADLDFTWSPDGAHLAMIRHADRTPQSRATIAFVRAADGVAIATDDTEATAVRWIGP